MGRTQRKRRREKSLKFRTCDDSKDVILLNSWLSENSMKRNEKLYLAVFEDTGRGVLTKKKICAGEELINLPLNLTVNVTSLLTDSLFCNIFLQNTRHCYAEYLKAVSFQSLMAFYIVFLKVQGPESKWFLYLNSLPSEYTVPYFLPNEIQTYLDSDILSVITKQKLVVESSFNIFKEILLSNISDSCVIENLKVNFTRCLYEWAYFTVNTRCVYMDLTKLINLSDVNNSLLDLICDNTKISLCPYLDMINHSPIAKNETKLLVSKGIENIPISEINENIFTNVYFSIFTKNHFDPYSEVFICYGDSHNLKLITEYGFYLPSNDLDYVSFTFEEVVLFLSANNLKLSQEQMSFVNSHNLNKDLYIDMRGLSFNFYGLLMVIKYFYNRNMDVSKLIYSAAICSNDRIIIDFITPMICEKLTSIKSAINKLETYDKCVILSNCVALMSQYVRILEKFIKC